MKSDERRMCRRSHKQVQVLILQRGSELSSCAGEREVDREGEAQ